MSAIDTMTPAPTASNQPRFSKDDLRALKARDNTTNFRYLLVIYVVIAITGVIAVWSLEAHRAGELATGWMALITGLSILSMGASQHQFGGVIHEGTHYILFENRKLNELASDWLAGFPIYTSTQAYRLSHFAHHQFVNDPKRDPILVQADESGHWLDFPADHTTLIAGVVRLLWPVNLIRYMIGRAKHSALHQDSNPFADKEHPGNGWPIKFGILFALGSPFVVAQLTISGQFVAAGTVLFTWWAALILYYMVIPERHFPKTHFKPVISDRPTIIMRMTYLAILYGGLTLTQYKTGAPVWGYFALLWVLPLLTAFPVFMIFREWVQHGNADRGRLTNSRVFFVDPISRYAVFPFGMDYHQPHHLFVSVPHYKLAALHDLMLRTDPDYERDCQLVSGWIGKGKNGIPTIVEVLGPKYTVEGHDVHVNEDTVEQADIANTAAIKQHVEASRRLQ